MLAAAAAAQAPPRRPNATAASRAAWKAACLPKVQQPSPKPKRVAIFVSKYAHCLWELLLRHDAGELPKGECSKKTCS